MPKGRKRTKEDYDDEIKNAAKRMKKYPEHLRAARNNSTWLNFLEDIGVKTIQTPKGGDFWENVRSEINKPEQIWSPQQLIERGAVSITRESKYGKKWYVYRNIDTGQFVSPKTLTNKRMRGRI